MKSYFSIFIFFLFSCTDNRGKNQQLTKKDSAFRQTYYPTYTKKLEEKTQTLSLEYIDWYCACAKWTTAQDYDEYNHNGLDTHSIFIEASDSALNLPDTIGYSGDIISVTGKFYREKGYPKHYEELEEKVDSARVFRYTKYEIIKSHYRDFVKDILIK